VLHSLGKRKQNLSILRLSGLKYFASPTGCSILRLWHAHCRDKHRTKFGEISDSHIIETENKNKISKKRILTSQKLIQKHVV
jgi:hypothetical protein